VHFPPLLGWAVQDSPASRGLVAAPWARCSRTCGTPPQLSAARQQNRADRPPPGATHLRAGRHE